MDTMVYALYISYRLHQCYTHEGDVQEDHSSAERKEAGCIPREKQRRRCREKDHCTELPASDAYVGHRSRH